MSEVKAIRVGDKIIVFINGKRETISKKVSPEVFEMVLGFIRNNETEKIINIFSSLDDNVMNYLKEYFEVKNGLLYVDDKKVEYSKLIIRKAVELMGMNLNPKPLFNLYKKIKWVSNTSEKISSGNNLFKKLNKVILTERGNLILHSSINGVNEVTNKVFGKPINIKEKVGGADGYNVRINEEETKSLILINPFDIISFNEFSINVSRFKMINKNLLQDENTLAKIENEELFDISFDIFQENSDKM